MGRSTSVKVVFTSLARSSRPLDGGDNFGRSGPPRSRRRRTPPPCESASTGVPPPQRGGSDSSKALSCGRRYCADCQRLPYRRSTVGRGSPVDSPGRLPALPWPFEARPGRPAGPAPPSPGLPGENAPETGRSFPPSPARHCSTPDRDTAPALPQRSPSAPAPGKNPCGPWDG